MNILLIGGLSVNPERFLPLLKEHRLFGIWESTSQWKTSLKAGGPYVEIPTIPIENIPQNKIDVVWCLISPWDGTYTLMQIKEKYPRLPIIRLSQGGATPWWHNAKVKTPTKKGKKKAGSLGNYSFKDFKKSLEMCNGLMFNCEEYRRCLIDQGIQIEKIPYILTNGMAFNSELVQIPRKKLSEKDGKPHVALIGRGVFDPRILISFGVHIHYHSTSKAPVHFLAHKERYYGDVHLLRRKPISLEGILNFKKQFWPVFTRYDAGLMHDIGHRPIDMFHGFDVNVPGRVNTYIAANLPPIVNEVPSGILSFLKRYSIDPYYLAFKDKNDLLSKLMTKNYMEMLHENLLKVQKKFTMNYELEHNIIPFFKEML